MLDGAFEQQSGHQKKGGVLVGTASMAGFAEQTNHMICALRGFACNQNAFSRADNSTMHYLDAY
jgi:hypothetical protein